MSTADARPTFSPRTVLILVVVGLVGFVGFGVLGAYAPELRAASSGAPSALSRSAAGYAGVVRLLRATGTRVEVYRGEAKGQPQPTPGLMVLTPPPSAGQKQVADLARRQPTLVVLPKWITFPDPGHPGWALRVGAYSGHAPLSTLAALASVTRRGGPGLVRLQDVGDPSMAALGPIRVDTLQTATGRPGVMTLVADQAGRPVLLMVSPGLYVLTDPDLMDNAGMASLPTARAALKIIASLKGEGGPVVFDVTLDGVTRPRTLLGLALSPPFLGASVCGLAAALLMGLQALVRFGPARPAKPALALGKAALLDNSAMLIRLARREPRMGRRYAALVRRLLARRVLAGEAASAELDAARLDALLDRQAERAGRAPFSALAGAVETAGDPAALAAAARRLHAFADEVLT